MSSIKPDKISSIIDNQKLDSIIAKGEKSLNSTISKTILGATISTVVGTNSPSNIIESVTKGEIAKNTISSIKNKTSDATVEAKNNISKKTVETISSASQKAIDKIESYNITKQVEEQFNGHEIQSMVTNLIDKEIDKMVKEEVQKAKRTYTSSDISKSINLAEAYYKKILNSEKLLSDMRTDYVTDLNKTINSNIIERFSKINIGGKWGQKLLGNSKIATSVANFVTKETASIIEAIISNKTITNVSQNIVNTVTRIRNASAKKLKVALKDQIAYTQKIKKAVEDQIQKFNKLKQQYIKKMQAYVDKLKSAILDQVKKLQKIVIDEISKVVKINAGSFSL